MFMHSQYYGPLVDDAPSLALVGSILSETSQYPLRYLIKSQHIIISTVFRLSFYAQSWSLMTSDTFCLKNFQIPNLISQLVL